MKEVPKRKKPIVEQAASPTLQSLGFDDAFYMISVSLEKFDLERFVRAIGGKEDYAKIGGLSFASEHPETGQYHVRLAWYVADEEIRLRVEYINDKREHADDERPPYAEGFMMWLGSFFKYSTAQVHTHAHLEFPVRSKSSRFPLPLKTAMVGDPEIDGISLKLPSKPEGISRVRIDMGSKFWRLQIVADKRIAFDKFNINEDIASYSETLKTLMEETV